MNNGNCTVRILKYLLISEEPVTTNDITSRVGCDRKTVAKSVDYLETIGFPIIISKIRVGSQVQNAYLWDGRIMGGIGQ